MAGLAAPARTRRAGAQAPVPLSTPTGTKSVWASPWIARGRPSPQASAQCVLDHFGREAAPPPAATRADTRESRAGTPDPGRPRRGGRAWRADARGQPQRRPAAGWPSGRWLRRRLLRRIRQPRPPAGTRGSAREPRRGCDRLQHPVAVLRQRRSPSALAGVSPGKPGALVSSTPSTSSAQIGPSVETATSAKYVAAK